MAESKVRILCTLPNASRCISDVRFGELSPATGVVPATLLSEPVDPEVAEHFCKGPGFELFDSASLKKAELAEIDDAIARDRAAAEALARGAGTQSAQVVTELERANKAQSAELQRLREERDTAVKALEDSSVPTLQAEVAKLAQDVVERDSRIKDLEGRIAELERINAELGAGDKGKGGK